MGHKPSLHGAALKQAGGEKTNASRQARPTRFVYGLWARSSTEFAHRPFHPFYWKETTFVKKRWQLGSLWTHRSRGQAAAPVKIPEKVEFAILNPTDFGLKLSGEKIPQPPFYSFRSPRWARKNSGNTGLKAPKAKSRRKRSGLFSHTWPAKWDAEEENQLFALR